MCPHALMLGIATQRAGATTWPQDSASKDNLANLRAAVSVLSTVSSGGDYLLLIKMVRRVTCSHAMPMRIIMMG